MWDSARSLNSLTAAGGLCAPTAVSYDLAQIAQAARPVRDSLPRFGADRGGIRFITPPLLTDVAGGVDVITEAEDAASASKPCATITCGAEVEELVDAVSLCLEIGNFSRRTFPEQFATWYQLALARHAREAEERLLDRMVSGSTAITDGQNLGAARDLLESWGRFAAQYRNRHRMDPEAPLTLLAPAWALDMIQADIMRQVPGDGPGTMALADAEIEAWIAARGLRVFWYQDSPTTGTSQEFGVQGAGAGLPWITTVRSFMFHPGAWLFLDGGTLDLGVEIRDSVLNAANNVRAFMETFEGLAFTGVQSLQISNTVCVSGQAAAPVDVTCPGVGS
jgi:hypothetical protein